MSDDAEKNRVSWGIADVSNEPYWKAERERDNRGEPFGWVAVPVGGRMANVTTGQRVTIELAVNDGEAWADLGEAAWRGEDFAQKVQVWPHGRHWWSQGMQYLGRPKWRFYDEPREYEMTMTSPTIAWIYKDSLIAFFYRRLWIRSALFRFLADWVPVVVSVLRVMVRR